MPTPLLIFSDSVATHSGLARITRDLAQRIHDHLPEFRVGTIGQGALKPDISLPWDQYAWDYNPEFIIHELPKVWKDFAGSEEGVFMSIQDANRMLWMADPEFCTDLAVRDFLYSVRPLKRMKLWGYFPVDGHDINGSLGQMPAHVLSKFDRVLAYTKFGAGVISQTLALKDPMKRNEVEYIPHGIDTEVFKPMDLEYARKQFYALLKPAWPVDGMTAGIPDDALAIGIVATNQARKDYGLAIHAIAEIAKTRKVFIWIHTDVLRREWSILELLSDFGLIDSAVVSMGNLSDETMAWCYSAMDVTLGIGRGEGFGFPIFESLACGTNCIHGNYGGAAEYMDPCDLVHVERLRVEGAWNMIRPVFDEKDWARHIQDIIVGVLDPRLDWSNLWPRWAQWFKEGL